MPQSDGTSTEGAVFAGYTIVRRLGAGGMGEVYLAQHPRLPRRDALKILPDELTENSNSASASTERPTSPASLYNEHIVGIHDRGEYEGQLWISMDYVEGTDAAKLLRERVSRRECPKPMSSRSFRPSPTRSTTPIHAGCCIVTSNPPTSCWADASPRRRILLADFGIARELGDISGLTATNMLMGTTAYCAPEQLQGLDLDGRADQYALGCTAFNLLTGSAPFQHSNPAVDHHPAFVGATAADQ